MPDELIALVTCVGPILAFVAWLVWLTRRPSRDCPQCGRRVAVSVTVCPACGSPLDQSPSPPAAEPRQKAVDPVQPDTTPDEPATVAPQRKAKKKGKKLKR